MYRKPDEYERMVDLYINIMEDYDIKQYPLNVFDLCDRMGINVIPYSFFEEDDEILLSRSKDGFNLPMCSKWKPTILYNDGNKHRVTSARISQTIGHEIKHICEKDCDDSEDDLCEYFSRYLRCPLPYVLYLGISSSLELISFFKISEKQAKIVLSNVNIRKKCFGNKFFRKEIVILKQLLQDDSKVESLELID